MDTNMEKSTSVYELLMDKSTAALADQMRHFLTEGHVCIHWEALEPEVRVLLPPPTSWPSNPWMSPWDQQRNTPFVYMDGYVYFHRYWHYETQIIHGINRLLQTSLPLPPTAELHNVVWQLFEEESMDERNIAPLIALLHSFRYAFTLITGGPGTGKTTSIARILAAHLSIRPHLRIALAAPTGKAANRMGEAIQQVVGHLQLRDEVRQSIRDIPQFTVHRLLGFSPLTLQFAHNASNPLPYDMLVVDEASMMDVVLFAHLMEALPEQIQLIVVGDRHQLASVEAGLVFGDLCTAAMPFDCYSEEDRAFYRQFIPAFDRLVRSDTPDEREGPLLMGHAIELKYSHRFDPHRGIGRFSNLVLSGQLTAAEIVEEFVAPPEGAELIVLPQWDEALLVELLEPYRNYVHEEAVDAAWQRLHALRILCAVNEGPLGVHALNALVEAHLQEEGLIEVRSPYYHRQPILITKNDYSLGLYNGDVGIVRYDEERERYLAYFKRRDEEGMVFYPASVIKDFQTTYAMTIHKSQGSEYDQVIIVLPEDAEHPLLTRELLYTAVTRARHRVYLFARPEVLEAAVQRHTRRMSGLSYRLRHRNTNLTE